MILIAILIILIFFIVLSVILIHKVSDLQLELLLLEQKLQHEQKLKIALQEYIDNEFGYHGCKGEK